MKWIVAQNGCMYPANRIVSVGYDIRPGIAYPIRCIKNSYGDECVARQDYVTICARVDGLDSKVKLWQGEANKLADLVRGKILKFLAGVNTAEILDLEGKL